MKQTVSTLLMLLFLTTSGSAQFGVKFQSQPNRKPPTNKFRISAQFRSGFNDLNNNGAPDIPMLIRGDAGDDLFQIMDGQSKDTLWQYPLSALPPVDGVSLNIVGFCPFPFSRWTFRCHLVDRSK